MHRRGLTLLELLIGIALLLAMGALCWPALMGELDERRFESAADLAQHHLVLARAYAQSNGRTVEVMYQPSPAPRLVSRHFEGGDDGMPARSFGGEVDDDLEGVIREGWARRELPGDVELTTTRPETGEANLEFGSGDARPIRLALFLSDGSAVPGETVWVTDSTGRAGRITIDAWTGLSAFERRDPDDDAPIEDEADEPERDAETDAEESGA